MFNKLIEKEIRNVKFEIEDLEILIDNEASLSNYERDELIDERYKLMGKLAGLEFALMTYMDNQEDYKNGKITTIKITTTIKLKL